MKWPTRRAFASSAWAALEARQIEVRREDFDVEAAGEICTAVDIDTHLELT